MTTAPHSATTARKRSRLRRRPARLTGRYYKGRGLIQITGYNNYRACSRDLLHDADELCRHPEMLECCRCLSLAAWYWYSRDLNALADAGKFDLITKAINGGYNGMADRQAYHARAQKALCQQRGCRRACPFSEQEAQPVSEDRPMVPFVAAALPALVQAAPSLIRIFGETAQAEKNAKAAEVAVGSPKAVTEQKTAEGAVTALQADPELASTYAKAVSAHWYELAGEAGGGGIAGARQADQAAMQQGKPWMSPALLVAVLILPLVYLVVAVMFGEGWTNDIRAMVVSSIISLVLGRSPVFPGHLHGSQQKPRCWRTGGRQ